MGKTTLVKAVINSYLPEAVVQSPTFVIERQYELPDPNKLTIHHVDCYRLKSEQEFAQLGLVEYFTDPQHLFFIEWPEVMSHIPSNSITIKITENKTTQGRIYDLS